MSPTTAPSSALSASGRFARLELFALYSFAFVLPLYEAPKNVLWLAYVFLWLANRVRARDFGGRWDAWDTLILLWIASGYVSAAFAGLHHGEWLSAFDILRYGLLLGCVRRAGYSETALGAILGAVVAGTLAGLARGYYGVYVTHENHFLGLNSVGHVNHSAIYAAIVFGAMVAWLRAAWTAERAMTRVSGVAICLAFGVSLIVMESRATVGVGFVVGFVILGIYAWRTGKPVWAVVLCAVLLAAAVFAAKPDVVRKNAERLHENLFLAHRDVIWRGGLIAWNRYPVFGVGMGNYGQIGYDLLEKWSHAEGKPFDRASVLPQSHAHSLYINTMVERGLVGLAALLAVLGYWGYALATRVPRRDASAILWAYWGGALSAWLVAILVGMVNTTLHHEHALVSMLLLGGWLSLHKRRPSPPADRT